MTDVTNRTVAALLFVAMAVTVFSTAITLNKLNVLQGGDLTGFASNPNATATLNVTGTTSIVFRVAAVDWENGTVNTDVANNCNLTTAGWIGAGYQGCTGFASPLPGDLILENDGNQNASITLQLNETPDSWIGGNAALAAMYAEPRDNESGSCLGSPGLQNITFTTTGTEPLCSDFQYEDPNDQMNIGLKVTIPDSAPPGQKSVRITATATAI